VRVLGDADPGEWAVEVDVPLAERRDSLRAAIDAIEERDLRLLVDAVLAGEVLERFLVAPAAKRYHSAKVGGLVVHTLAVYGEALHLAGAHCRLRLDLDLLRAGALLHDVGKADELEVSARTGLLPGYTGAHPQGHVALGIRRVERAAAELAMLDDRRVDHLVHLLVSHHGAREHGAPEPPMTPEAVVLHMADLAASRIEGVCDLVEATPEGALWTERSGMFGEPLYLGWR
jgi:3'-5' exoribonuclease